MKIATNETVKLFQTYFILYFLLAREGLYNVQIVFLLYNPSQFKTHFTWLILYFNRNLSHLHAILVFTKTPLKGIA